MENSPKKSEETNESSENGGDKMKVWFQENMRMVISIVIVIAIAGGIYAYSKRTQAPMGSKESAISEQEGEGKISVIGGQDNDEENTSEEESATQIENGSVPENQETPEAAKEAPAVQAETSKETGDSFVEIASKGDGTTKLARRALANYLEKSPDSSLSAEQKIYIEDYLRRQVSNGKLKIGDSREFSKDLIAKGIEKSKGLSENQLKNLKKYSQRVSGLN